MVSCSLCNTATNSKPNKKSEALTIQLRMDTMMAISPARHPLRVLYSLCAAAKAKLAERASHINTCRIVKPSCKFKLGGVK
jgi:hypothetical protein